MKPVGEDSGARPLAVAILAGFLFFATAISIVVSSALLFPGPLLDWLAQFNRPAMSTFQALAPWPGILLAALAVGTFAAAVGLLRGRKWAWWFSVVLFAVNGTGDLLSFLATRDLIRSLSGVVIAAAFLIALSTGSVRRYVR